MFVKKSVKADYIKLTKIFLYLIALHSFVVALALMLSPSWLMEQFGYSSINEPFFKVQAGVFHIVMVVAYMLAASDPIKNKIMVIYSITIKFIATIFLVVYFIFINPVIVILLSGFGDLAMGLILVYLYKNLSANTNNYD